MNFNDKVTRLEIIKHRWLEQKNLILIDRDQMLYDVEWLIKELEIPLRDGLIKELEERSNGRINTTEKVLEGETAVD